MKPILTYGALLAGGAALLQWLEYKRLVVSHSGDIGMALLAALFLGLGIWVGAQLFARPRPAHPIEEGNPAALATLGISPREFEVLSLIAKGLSNKDIARRLHISPNTVKTHVARLLDKLDARRRTEAISRARALGLMR